jgi:hypothetical protein
MAMSSEDDSETALAALAGLDDRSGQGPKTTPSAGMFVLCLFLYPVLLFKKRIQKACVF